ncbi:uncharacterized protein LOC143146009 isoform X1 [Ptiloglossa arizonensis]|uniref:uncharacterized protein LOC143146009 isoform X1 n=1 Tax=Ptiloglossa arizonensis TaxID=3350558 RepID=UPI003FA0A548
MMLLLLGIPLILSIDNDGVSKISSMLDVENIETNTDSDKLDINLFETYPILVPPNMVLQICLKDTTLLDKLHTNINDCDNYPCMFSKIIKDESMKSVVSIIRNDTMDNMNQEFKQSIQDCVVWWKLFKHFDKNANPRRELGRCLFQTFSSKCREPALDKIKLFLTTTEKR